MIGPGGPPTSFRVTNPGSGDDIAGRRRRRPAAPGRRREAKKGSLLRELPVLLLIAFVLALVVKTFFVQAFFIPSGSMEQTLHGCTGLHRRPGAGQQGPVLVRRARARRRSSSSRARTPGRRRSSVAEPSNWFTGALLWLGRTVGVAPPSEDDFVKRVIATGGQTVQCCDAQGRVTVDGKPLDEPYIFENTPIESRAFGPVTVPEGRLWVMGDHRSASADSKAHIGDKYSGTIGVDDVIGKAAVIVWPVSRFGLLDSPGHPGHARPRRRPACVAGAAGVGLAGAVPVVAWRRRRRLRRRD